MSVFELARLRPIALAGVYLRTCAPSWRRSDHAAVLALPLMTTDQMAAAILAARISRE